MHEFEAPDADWTDEYSWTRYRGPEPYPCPADWVLGVVEGDGVGWKRYPGIGEGLGHEHDVDEVFDGDFEEQNEARKERATLLREFHSAGIRDDGSIEHKFKVDGKLIFRHFDPDNEDLWATVAEILARYSGGEELDEIETSWSTGRPPDSAPEQQEVQQRKEQNQQLGDFL